MIVASDGRRNRRLQLALGTSALIYGFTLPTAAHAQCAPDPTVANATTNCSGTDSDGLVVDTFGTSVTVEPDASVRAGSSGAAIAVTQAYVSLKLRGLVDGEGNPAISMIAGPAFTAPCDPYAGASFPSCTPGTTITIYPKLPGGQIDVAAGGTVSGSQALYLGTDPSNPTGGARVTISNYGSMIGTAGPAIVGNSGSDVRVYNWEGGFIGGIEAPVSYLENAGILDGGSFAAIVDPGVGVDIYNSGQIISSGSAATISSLGDVFLTNTAGAVLGGSADAIIAGARLEIINEGTIIGSVTSTTAVRDNSVVDTRNGIIEGDLIFGAGNDSLRAQFDLNTGTISSITGTVDGGAGTDTLTLSLAADTTLASAVLPTNFERLGLELIDNPTLTLAPTFSGSGSLFLTGRGGRVVNQASLLTAGPAITSISGFYISFRNEADITANLSASEYAVNGPSQVVNNGAITALGGSGVVAALDLTNSGMITASGIGASSLGTFANTGTIVSTGDIGARVSGSSMVTPSLNSGTISGATIGLDLSLGRFENTGTITGGSTGVALGSATFINSIGGTVTGSAAAIVQSGVNSRIVNAGTINGTVSLQNFSNDVFVDAGGIVNGSVLLGDGDDQLILEYNRATTGPLAGATGNVDSGAGTDTLRYLINSDASIDLTQPSSFEALAFELDNNPVLLLSAPAALIGSIGLTGNGSVSIDADLANTGQALIDTTILTLDQLTGGGAGPVQDLTIVSNGSLDFTTGFSFGTQAGILAGTSSLTNNGAITVTRGDGYVPSSSWGIFGGTTVTNAGSIALVGDTSAIAIGYSADVINSGSITATGIYGVAVADATSLLNSGSIRTEGSAVQAVSTISNMGLIQSNAGTAVSLSYGGVLTNEATGTITGATAVDFESGGLIVNRGTIDGNVQSSPFSYGINSYFADGGTLTGDVIFGSGFGEFLMSGSDSGVTGTIDGGDGRDVIGHLVSATSSVSIDPDAQFVNFENALVQVASPSTTATLTAANTFAGDLYVSGMGTVVNTADVTGQVLTIYPYETFQVLPTFDFQLAAFDNQGSIGNGVYGAFGQFTNSGSIAIADSGIAMDVFYDTGPSFANSGQVDGGTQFASSAGPIGVANSGTISSSNIYGASAVRILLQATSGMQQATIVNSGTIATSQGAGSVPSALTVSSAGSAAISIINTATGTISADTGGYGIFASGTALTLDNAGLISAASPSGFAFGAAVLSFGARDDTVLNTGTIEGSVILDASNDRVDNYGNITGIVSLGSGDDSFVQHGGAALGVAAYGGAGSDSFIIDSTGDGALDAAQLSGFETLTQMGGGTFSYSGSFDVATIGLEGGELAVADGQTLETTSATTVTGGNEGVAVLNSGTIAGAITLGSGADNVANFATIGGLVQLGAGDDTYLEGLSSLAAVGVDGGSGIDLYRVQLAGDRTGIGANVNFEQLSVEGTGTLTLALQQDYQSIALANTGLTLALGGYTIGQIITSGTVGPISLDGDVGGLALGGGDDTLTLPAATLAGLYSGGAGNDLLQLTNAGPVLLSGTVAGFETVTLAGNALDITGTLGAAGQALALSGTGGAGLVLDNSGTILGTVTLGSGADTVTNLGTIGGSLQLGAGDDSFYAGAASMISGTVDGGTGSDLYRIALAGDRTGLGGEVVGFESLAVEGNGTLSLVLTQSFETIVLGGNGLALTQGGNSVDAILGSTGAESVLADGVVGLVSLGADDDSLTLVASLLAGNYMGGTGSDGLSLTSAEPVDLTGSISGFETIALGSGSLQVSGALGAVGDTVAFGSGAQTLALVNGGTLSGDIDLGDGDDTLALAPDGILAGTVTGSAGVDLLRLGLSGDRTGLGNVSGFENIAVEGTGTLDLALAQDFDKFSLSGTGLSLTLAGYGVGWINGSDGSERVLADGDIAAIWLGAGDDTLSLAATSLAGVYDGGAGSDQLSLADVGPIVLSGTVEGFETIATTGGSLAVTGKLGAAGGTLAFLGGAQDLALVTGGIADGAISLGEGDDLLRLAGGTIAGSISGGTGSDQIVVTTNTDTVFSPNNLSGFELLATTGPATLTLASTQFSFDRVDIAGGLVVAGNASLATPMLGFSDGDNSFILDGSFTGSVDGGAGNDLLMIGGADASFTSAFASITGFETFAMTGGLANLAGPADFTSLTISGGRFIGLAGSMLTSPTIIVAQGATFGSAGTVNGDSIVNGTLSPGASVATMTVNGNIALGPTSTSLFELSASQADQLVVNGALTIAPGATLTLTALQPVTPGQSFDLITATGGISGSFTSVNQTSNLLGFLVQQANVLTLLGQFANDASYAPDVQRNIDYLNDLLANESASTGVLAGIPSLATANGSPDTGLIAALDPDAYAGTRDTLVEAGLMLSSAMRQGAFDALGSDPGVYAFASGLAGQRKLDGDGTVGDSKLRASGVAGGLGYGSASASAGLFVGYLATSLDGAALASKSEADGYAIGLTGHVDRGALSTRVSVAYFDADQDLQRVAPFGSAGGSFGLDGWIADASVGYNLLVGERFEIVPSVGITAIRATRDAVTESGSSAFVLNVAKDKQTTAFVDFGVAFGPQASSSATIRPFAEIGTRHIMNGRDPVALGAFGGGPTTLIGVSAMRDPWVGRASAGLAAELSDSLSLDAGLSGEFGKSESAVLGHIGIRLSL